MFMQNVQDVVSVGRLLGNAINIFVVMDVKQHEWNG
jgi:hypothetical protein